MDTVRTRNGFIASDRYHPQQWDEIKSWEYYTAGGETWFGFEAVYELEGLPPEILLIPLVGHTQGHAGDAYF
ncbi:MAG TPA: hypothetical protein IGS53_01895 [Leptolyngbyaceae cyanobacterium M33_DOE_097]|nr:hypothetical protein [Leptolyngbyaceae cyanobacterium M33_DOE_097]